MNERVFIDRIQDSQYLPAIRDGLDFIGFENIVTNQSRIFLKLNLTFPEYRPGVMTSPQAAEAAIIAIRDYTSHIFIGDSDSGGYNRFSMDQVYQTTGIYEIAAKNGVKIVNLSKGERRKIQFSYRGKSFSLSLPILLLDEMDHLVTLPVPKIHANTGVSLTFKNQWGCIPENNDRLLLHPYFQHVILEVNRAVKAGVAIMDGQYGLNGNGPMKGNPIPLDWVLVSSSLGSGAQIACDLMQIKLDSIAHLRYAKRMGWIPDREKINVNQDYRPFLKQKFFLKRKWTDWPGYLAFHNPAIAYLAYFSPFAGILHQLLYLIREPFYEYNKTKK